jgi:hypothetical protein
MADAVEFAEFLDVEVDQLARTCALIAVDWFRPARFQIAYPVLSSALSDNRLSDQLVLFEIVAG